VLKETTGAFDGAVYDMVWS